MKSRLMQIILLAGLFSCNKNFDSFQTPVPQTNLPNPSFFVSSDTIVETEEIADGGRYIFRSYWLTSTSPVKEGNSVTIKMNTKNVVRGAVIAYTITGIDSNDITSGKLTGNFIIGSNGTDSVTYILKADNKTEGTETMKTSSKGASLLVSISDSSQTPAAPPVTCQRTSIAPTDSPGGSPSSPRAGSESLSSEATGRRRGGAQSAERCDRPRRTRQGRRAPAPRRRAR